MRDRLQGFSLSLHPKKTRLIEFGRHAANNREQRGLGKPQTFNFLAMSFICGKSRGGKFLLKRRTRRDRMQAKIKEVAGELRRRMHQSIPEQGKWLKQVITGFFNYHAACPSRNVRQSVQIPSACRFGDAFAAKLRDVTYRAIR
jgi:hypothetical protein